MSIKTNTPTHAHVLPRPRQRAMQRVRAGVAALCFSTLVFVCNTHVQLPGLRRRPARALGVEASVLEQALTHALQSSGVHKDTKPAAGTPQQTPSRGLPPGVVALKVESGAGTQKSLARDAGSQKELPALEFGNATEAGADGQRRGLPAKPFACFRSDALKFAFVHIPKNAGSAVSRYLEELLCAHAQQAPGCGLKLARGTCPQDPTYYVFTFSRNPWARAVSMWSYGMKRLQLETQDVDERKAIARRYCTFEAFVQNLKAGRAQPGCGFHVADRQYPNIYARDGTPGVNFLGRTEHFDRDFRVILQAIDPSGRMLEYYERRGFTMHNDSGHKSFAEYYTTQAMKDAVAKFYAQDMQLGYRFETDGASIVPARYHDGRPAGELSYGDVV